MKKTSDLLLVMSNLYTLDHGSLMMSAKVWKYFFSFIFIIYISYLQRMFPSTPLVKLGENNFKNISAFLSRFGSIPDLLELDHITVSGDVTFGRGG